MSGPTAQQSALSPPVGNMKVRLGVDASLGHPPRAAVVPVTGSITVFTDQIPQVRVTDMYAPHLGHVPFAAQGSTTVYTDQLMTHRFLDRMTCKDFNVMGSLTTYAGI